MSTGSKHDSGAAQRARRATEQAPESSPAGGGRWSAKRKMSVVLELLRGADLEATSRKHRVTIIACGKGTLYFTGGGETNPPGLTGSDHGHVHSQMARANCNSHGRRLRRDGGVRRRCADFRGRGVAIEHPDLAKHAFRFGVTGRPHRRECVKPGDCDIGRAIEDPPGLSHALDENSWAAPSSWAI